MKGLFLADSGQSLYLYPIDPNTKPLSDWSTHRIPVTEKGFPDFGLYEVDLENVDINQEYALFSDDAIPANWSAALRQVSFEVQRLEANVDSTAKLLTGGRVVQVSPVTATGQIAGPIVAGDDYLAANSRAFVFYFAPQTFDLATAEFWFGGQTQRGTGWLVQGTVEADTLEGEAVWKGTAELTQEETSALQPRIYNWSAQVRNGTSEVITQRIGVVRVVRGFTPVVQS
jgi:hypothetical protein